MSRPRIVFDTSTLVSAALIEGSIPFQALFLAFDLYEVCVSEATLIEFAEVLLRSKFDRRITRKARFDFLFTFGTQIRAFSIEANEELSLVPPCRDEKDNKFLSLAAAAKAVAIVSIDQDLLILHPWNGISILTPADFLAQFQA